MLVDNTKHLLLWWVSAYTVPACAVLVASSFGYCLTQRVAQVTHGGREHSWVVLARMCNCGVLIWCASTEEAPIHDFFFF